MRRSSCGVRNFATWVYVALVVCALLECAAAVDDDPVCDDRVVGPVYWDSPFPRFPVYHRRLKMRLASMQLEGAPEKPLGRLVFHSNDMEVRLGTFIPRPLFLTMLRYQLFDNSSQRIPEHGATDAYRFRLTSREEESCIVRLNITVRRRMNSDSLMLSTESSGNRTRSYSRFELVDAERMQLLALVGGRFSGEVPVRGVVIREVPLLGKLYRLRADVSPETGAEPLVGTPRRFALRRSFCTQNDCELLAQGAPLQAGATVDAGSWVSTSGASSTPVWVLYRPPPARSIANESSVEHFVYEFSGEEQQGGGAGGNTVRVQVQLSVRRAGAGTIFCRYRLPDIYDEQSDAELSTAVPCVLSTSTSHRFMIRGKSDLLTRYGAEPWFTLHQAKQRGKGWVPSTAIAESTVDAVTGLWLPRDNTVVVVPKGGGRQDSDVQFEVTRYDFGADDGRIVEDAASDFVVRVIQENSKPKLFVDKELSLDHQTRVLTTSLLAFDADGDPLTFFVTRGPRNGTLAFDDHRFGEPQKLTVVRESSAIRVASRPKDPRKTDLTLRYTPSHPGRVDDFVSVIASDSSGSVSNPIELSIGLQRAK